MNELEQATRRLEQAVARLETASRQTVEHKPAAKSTGATAETAAMVAIRLDEAIQRLDRLLES
jgi:outer membrane murein-binding lipoprotein Lpp